MSSKYRAAHNLSPLNPDDKVSKGRDIIGKLTSSTYLDVANLPIPVSSITLSVDNLDNSIVPAKSGAPGAVSHMHEMERVMVDVFNLLKAYIVLEANRTSDPKSFIESVGFSVVNSRGSSAVSDLTLTAPGGGIIEVSVPRSSGVAAFTFQYSTDAGVTWQLLDSSKLATVQLKGQTPGSNLFIRYAPIGKTQGVWSQAKSVIVN